MAKRRITAQDLRPKNTDIPELPGSLAQQLRDIGMGKRPMPTTDAIRHHYIAQFILREFLDPTQPRERLWQLDKTNGEIHPQSTEKAASVQRLYRVEGADGNPTDHLEAFFSMIESHGATSMRLLLDESPDFDHGDRVNLSLLFALQDQRTPAEQKKIIAHLGSAARLLAATNLASNYREINRRYLNDNPGITYEEADEMRLEAIRDIRDGKVIIEPSKETALQMSLNTWLEYAGRIVSLSWKVLRSDDAEFVIGDRPMIMHDPAPEYPFSGNGLISSPLSYTLMPLTPNTCLRFDQSGGPLEVRRAERQVGGINLRSYGWAERFVYSRTKTVLEELHARALADSDAVPAPKENPQVIMEEADPDDSSVGAHHPPGYPKGLWHGQPGEERRFFSYDVQHDDDHRTVGVDDTYLLTAKELKELGAVRATDPVSPAHISH